MVLVAANPIQKGTTGEAILAATGLYKVEALSPDEVQTDAITDPATLVGKVALVDITANTQLTTADFAARVGEPNPGPARWRRAVTLRSPKVIGGPLVAGDRVNASLVEDDSGNLTVKLLQLGQNMRVVAVNGATVTLEALPRQAGKLIYAMQRTKLQTTNARLVLRRRS